MRPCGGCGAQVEGDAKGHVCPSEEQGYPAGNRGEKSEAIYEDFCKCYDLAMLASSYWPELPGSFGGTVSERLSVTLTAEHNAREAAEERSKALEDALRGKCDEYRMHDPGWCAACDAARAVLEQSK
jgi:hypothetical protein